MDQKIALNTLRGILEKCTTTSNSYISVKEIQALAIHTELELAIIVEFIFEKVYTIIILWQFYNQCMFYHQATLGFTDDRMPSICAKICKGLSSKEVSMLKIPAETTNIRKLLLAKCQRQLEMSNELKMEIVKSKDVTNTTDSLFWF